MNKITKLSILFLFISFILNAQTYSTGMVSLSNTTGLEMNVKLEITATEITLTFNGPADRWIAIGFGGNDMNSVTDAFIYESAGTYDKKIVPYSTPQTDTNQDWTLISNNVTGNVREIIATRALNTGENDDYVFSYSANSIPVIWARGNGAVMDLAYHGSNKGATVLNPAVLGIDNQEQIHFALYPNPVKDNLKIVLQSNATAYKYEIYSVIGTKVQSGILNKNFNKISVNNFNSGVYLLKITNSLGDYIVKQFVKK